MRVSESRAGGYEGRVPSEPDLHTPRFPTLRFVAMLKAAADFGLDQEALDRIALQFDPRRPDLDWIADALASALRHRILPLPDAV